MNYPQKTSCPFSIDLDYRNPAPSHSEAEEMGQLLTVRQAADALGLRAATIRAWVSPRAIKKLTLWLSLGAAIVKFVQVLISLFHGDK